MERLGKDCMGNYLCRNTHLINSRQRLSNIWRKWEEDEQKRTKLSIWIGNENDVSSYIPRASTVLRRMRTVGLEPTRSEPNKERLRMTQPWSNSEAKLIVKLLTFPVIARLLVMVSTSLPRLCKIIYHCASWVSWIFVCHLNALLIYHLANTRYRIQ